MSTHMQGLTVSALELAQMRAVTTDHSVTLVDDTAHVVVVVDQQGHVVMRPEERGNPEWLYRTAGT
jgi:hypothetical protein